MLYGEVVEMSDGVLYIKTAAAADNIVKIKWANVEKLAINHPIPFHLKEGSVLIGTATEGPNGTINVRAEPLKETIEIPVDSITALNPLVQPPVIYKGTLDWRLLASNREQPFQKCQLAGRLRGSQ